MAATRLPDLGRSPSIRCDHRTKGAAGTGCSCNGAAGAEVRTNYNLQDAGILNVIRACDTAIDLANMAIRKRHFGIPNESRESFAILVRESIISPELGDRLKRMVGFHNLAVHQYRELDLDILDAAIRKNLDELLTFAQVVRPEF